MEPNKSQIPSLKDTKKPELKVKGMAVGMSLVDRVKSFRKKDLAFIGAGLAVLFLAPLVEHFLMTPEGGQPGAFKEGWTFGRGDAGSGSFGKGGSPYEPGVSGLAPGGLLGSGSEIITPLNVRDPSSLVMGPGQSSAQPVTAAPAPAPAASAAKPASDWKDALAAAAGRGAGAAAKAASLPVPKVPLQGGLRGLGVLGGGGSGASWSGGGVGPAAGSSRPAGSSSLTNIKTPTGFQGVAGKRGNSPSGSIEDLKKAGDKAAEGFNRGGGAGSNLLTSADASQAIPGGGSSGGAGGSAGDGKEDKAGGANHDMRTNSRGEPSLEYLMKKDEMQREMDLKWEKKKKNEMFWPDLQRDIQKELMMSGLVKPFAEGIGGMVKDTFGFITGRDRASVIWECYGDKKWGPKAGDLPACKAKDGSYPCYRDLTGGNFEIYDGIGSGPAGTGCKKIGGGPPPPGDGTQTGGAANPAASPEVRPGEEIDPKTQKPTGDDLVKQCDKFASLAKPGTVDERMLGPVNRLILAYSYTTEVGYRSKASASQCKPVSTLDAKVSEKDAKTLHKDAGDTLNTVNKNISDDLKMVKEQVAFCILPQGNASGGSCQNISAGMKQVNGGLNDGAGCKCSCDAAPNSAAGSKAVCGCKDCDDKAKTVEKGMGDGEYLSAEIKNGEGAWKEYNSQLKDRQEKAETITKVSDGKGENGVGWMHDSKKLLEAAAKELGDDNSGAKKDLKAIKSEMANKKCDDKVCEEGVARFKAIDEKVVPAIEKELAKRKEAQEAVEEAFKVTKKAKDVVLPTDKGAKSAETFVKWLLSGEGSPSTGFSKDFKADDGINLKTIKPKSLDKFTTEFNAARAGDDVGIKAADAAEEERVKLAGGADKDGGCYCGDKPCSMTYTGICATAQLAAKTARDNAIGDATKAWTNPNPAGAFQKAIKEFEGIAPTKAKSTGEFPTGRFNAINPCMLASDSMLKNGKKETSDACKPE